MSLKVYTKHGGVIAATFFCLFTLYSCDSTDNEEQNDLNGQVAIETKYAGSGPCLVKTVEYYCPVATYGKYRIWYPSDMDADKQYPLVIMVNGSGTPSSKYEYVFEHLASWGFIVAGNEDSGAWDGKSSDITLSFILSLKENSQSIFYQKIDTSKIGIGGHSQGAVGVYNAVTEYHTGQYYRAAYLASCTELALAQSLTWNYYPEKLSIPSFFTAGTGDWDTNTISPLKSLEDNMSAMPPTVPVVIARRVGKEHEEMLREGDPYMTAWFCFWLKDDKYAASAFTGKDAEIMFNKRWQDVKTRNL